LWHSTSYHHKNTEKIANVFAKVLDAQIKTPQQVNPEEIQVYGLTGFGSGIYSGKHHESLLELADKLPHATIGKHSFSQPVESRSSWLAENLLRIMLQKVSKRSIVYSEHKYSVIIAMGGSNGKFNKVRQGKSNKLK